MVKLLPFPGSSCATNMLWVSVCPVVLPVGVSCMWKHVWHQLLVLPASFPVDDCQSLADVSGRVRGDLGTSWDSLKLNKCLNSNISLQIRRRGGGNFPHKVKHIEYWIGILYPSASLGALQEQGVMSRCCSRP